MAIVVTLLLLSIVIGAGSILVGQLKTVRGIENSVVSLSAADAGIEKVLSDIYSSGTSFPGSPSSIYPTTPLDPSNPNGPKYSASVFCCSIGGGDCFGGASCPAGLTADPNCHAFYLYCIESIGTFNGTRRALRVNI